MGGRGDRGDVAEGWREGILKVGEKDGGGEGWPVKAGHFGEGVDDGVCSRPREAYGIGRGTALDVVRSVGEDEVAVGLGELVLCLLNVGGLKTHLWKTIPIEYKSMQQLPSCKGHQHPAYPPPRLVIEPTIALQCIICKFCSFH